MAPYTPLNDDQIREVVNTVQRFGAWQAARVQRARFRGSMVWAETKGHAYLVRADYGGDAGRRRQQSLGPRSPQTEALKATWEADRDQATSRLDALKAALDRQAAVNRALRLGRVPSLSARLIRALDMAGWLGTRLRIIGTHALYAYEAVAGVHFDTTLATTQDLDLLIDSRQHLRLMALEPEWQAPNLLELVRRVDRSFAPIAPFRAANDDGFLVDIVKPMPVPPWRAEDKPLGPDDFDPVAIEGLSWLRHAPSLDAVAIDDRGHPLRMVVADPRVFAAHKIWLSQRDDRAALQRPRDRAQADAVAALVNDRFAHLSWSSPDLTAVPLSVIEAVGTGLMPGRAHEAL